ILVLAMLFSADEKNNALLDKIEAAYHRNSILKQKKMFSYRIYGSKSPSTVERWKSEYPQSEHVKCTYFEDEKWIVAKEVFDNDEVPSQSAGATPTTLYQHYGIVFIKIIPFSTRVRPPCAMLK
ncbi:MAG TPA: hypothetical protein PKA06_10515, partial [Gemmatales bacterium]|nr:hypothetical protein [Gemmatales bacterium]